MCSERESEVLGVDSTPDMSRVVSVCDRCRCNVPPRLPGSGEGDGEGDRRVLVLPSPGLPPTLPDMRRTSRGDSRPARA